MGPGMLLGPEMDEAVLTVFTISVKLLSHTSWVRIRNQINVHVWYRLSATINNALYEQTSSACLPPRKLRP